ncbi:MAG: hypothetical protein JNK65_01525 [Deltaproteobacteria bacterium]|nr:hypothetical protein [Deltaproteobacteria bacterium]
MMKTTYSFTTTIDFSGESTGIVSKGSRSFTFRKISRVFTKVLFRNFGNIRENFDEKTSGMESKREVEETSIDVVW